MVSMTAHQRIVRVRRNYNNWVANETLEDYALRFTAKNARRWSSLRVANTAIGAISFLALEAIGGAITVNYGLTLFIGYVVISLVVIPLVTHGITFISRLQLWTQPVWIILHVLPFTAIAIYDSGSFEGWAHYGVRAEAQGLSFNLALFGAASTVVFSLIAQIGE